MPIDGSIIGAGAAGSGLSATTASVVNNKADTEAAFCKAERVTFVGSTIPASTMFTHSPLAALNPIPKSTFLVCQQSLILHSQHFQRFDGLVLLMHERQS